MTCIYCYNISPPQKKHVLILKVTETNLGTLSPKQLKVTWLFVGSSRGFKVPTSVSGFRV